MTIAIITLEKHADGIWITNLVREIRHRLPTGDDVPKVEVVVLEHLFPDLGAYSSSSSSSSLPASPLTPVSRLPIGAPPPWSLVVNRISDAAPPPLAKMAHAVLECARIWNISIFNGPRCYGVGCSKHLHHAVFARAGLVTPRSILVGPPREGGGDGDSGCDEGASGDDGGEGGGDGEVSNERRRKRSRDGISRAIEELRRMGCEFPFLAKPNSAGFGVGIQLLQNADEAMEFADSHSQIGISNDGVFLLQEYMRPVDDFIYRIWFLDGGVQCAVKRPLLGGDVGVSTDGGSDDFTSGCAGGSCSIQSRNRRKLQAWRVPEDVANDIRRVLAVVGDDCNAGSVEMLYHSEGSKVYFDLNMLSTLPVRSNGTVVDVDGVWDEEYDPWAELAESVLQKI